MTEIHTAVAQVLTEPALKTTFDAAFGAKGACIPPECAGLIDSLHRSLTDAAAVSFAGSGRLDNLTMLNVVATWAASMVRPAVLPQLPLRRADIERVDVRHYLALALPAGLAEGEMLAGVRRQYSDRSANHVLCDILHIDDSTLYRLQRRARANAAKQIAASVQHDARWFDALVRAVCHRMYRAESLDTRQQRIAWHLRQASLCESAGFPIEMVWHLAIADDWDGVGTRLHIHILEAVALSSRTAMPSMRQLLDWLFRAAPELPQKARLQRVLAIVHDVSGDRVGKLQAHEAALQLAQQSKQLLPLANAYHDLAVHYMLSDADLTDSLFRRAIDVFERDSAGQTWAEDYCYTLINYALAQTRKFNASSIGLLRRAEALPLPAICQARANLHYLWGMVESRIGNHGGALRHFNDAIAIYLALNDRINLRLIQVNMGLALLTMERYSDALRAFDQALQGNDRVMMSKSDLAFTYVSRADVYRMLERFQDALADLERTATLSAADDYQIRAELFDSLARTYHTCWLKSGDLEQRMSFEQALSGLEAIASKHPAAKKLFVNLQNDVETNRSQALSGALLPPERAEYYAELSEIDRLREQTVADSDLAKQLNARLGIARIYLDLSIKERQAALNFAAEHNLVGDTTEAVLAMVDRHNNTLNVHDRVINRWHERSGLDPADVGVIISHFEREPKLTKRAYMALTKVSAATASRVIARLLASGLITQEGAGAATCYRLA